MIFSGVCTALVTPFNKDKSIDFYSLKKLLEFQLVNNVDAILILGTTGESSTISVDEREKIIKFSKNIIKNKCKLIVGTGANSTDQAIKLTKQAETLGVDGCLVVTPYYNKCTQQGVIEHYSKIISSTNLPVIIYNVPSRTGFNIEPETVNFLTKFQNFAGIKEANGNIDHILKLFFIINKDIPVYCGNDNLNFIFKSLNANGTISVLSNLKPKEVLSLWKNDLINSRILDKDFYLINKFLFIEPNPIPIKFLLSKNKLIKNYLRLPLTPLSKRFRNYNFEV